MSSSFRNFIRQFLRIGGVITYVSSLKDVFRTRWIVAFESKITVYNKRNPKIVRVTIYGTHPMPRRLTGKNVFACSVFIIFVDVITFFENSAFLYRSSCICVIFNSVHDRNTNVTGVWGTRIFLYRYNNNANNGNATCIRRCYLPRRRLLCFRALCM